MRKILLLCGLILSSNLIYVNSVKADYVQDEITRSNRLASDANNYVNQLEAQEQAEINQWYYLCQTLSNSSQRKQACGVWKQKLARQNARYNAEINQIKSRY
jgi:hypothetical protein